MAKVHAAIMVAPGTFTVTGSAGHTVNFTANEETYVPPVMVSECRRYGAREVRRFKDIVAEVPDVSDRTMRSAVIPRDQAVGTSTIEVTSAEDEAARLAEAKDPDGPPPPPNADVKVRYTENENRVKAAILDVLSHGGVDDCTSSGIPKMRALNDRLEVEASAETRDEVIDKMKAAGDLPEDFGDG